MTEQVLRPMMPPSDPAAAFFWEGVAEHQLLIQRCQSCGTYQHPPKVVCSTCLATDLAPEQVSGRATLVTWTQPMQNFDPFYQQRVPYVFATVNLEEQTPLRFATNIVDCPEESLRIDLPLVVTFTEVAPDVTLPLFRPAS